jgi:hypothetical protein
MREVLPGVFHWTAQHPQIHSQVSCYWLEDTGVLIDPLVPPELGLEWFATRTVPPTAILLSNRHHYRDSARFEGAFGCAVHCNRAGLHEFIDQAVHGFDIGAQLPGGVVAHEVGAICPDDTALHLPDARALLFADGIVRGGPPGGSGPLGFVPTPSWTTRPKPSAGCSPRASACSTSSTSSTSCSPTAGPSSAAGATCCATCSTTVGAPRSGCRNPRRWRPRPLRVRAV